MNRIVADADIIIDHLRDKTETFLELQRLHSQAEIELIIPTVVAVQLISGSETRDKNKLNRIKAIFATTSIVELDLEISHIAGELLRDYPRMSDLADAVIAATALHLSAKLSTRNKKDFEFVEGLKFYEGI